MFELKIPFEMTTIQSLRSGDQVLISGNIFTARDKAHQFLLEKEFPEIRGGIIYHAGPLMKGNEVISAGPTTSARMNKYTPAIIEKYHINTIIGKGGMSAEVLNAIQGKAVYFSAIGGAGVMYADKMKFRKVYQKSFGMPDAIWEFEVKDFPVIVTMDSVGNTLYKEIQNSSKKQLESLIRS